MGKLRFLLLFLAICCFIVGGLDQRKLYWKTSAWRYRIPEANEPSDAACKAKRIGLFATGLVLIAIALG
ncbi:hypothetical protein [Actinomadura atramentaria]|uniref:hypothetical protein n=1 Tax=Actinomadura atramentaria TaxID=1990 RepID=UPI00036FDFF7|nr:hypothetical protein [Actinomadura atramentaria]